jgi:1,4-alpha-glucan branching enzyme
MKKISFILLFISAFGFSQVQTVNMSVSPNTFNEDNEITITFSNINPSIWGVSDIYLWSWSYDLNDANSMDATNNGSWTNSDEQQKLTNNGNGTYSIIITPTTFYNRTDIGKIGMLIKAKDGTGDKKSQDLYLDVGAFQLTLTAPSQTVNTLNLGQSLSVTASTSLAADYVLKANGTIINTASSITSYSFTHTNITQNTSYSLEATNGGETITRTFHVIVSITEATVPSGLKDGLNLDPNDATKATLVLYAPSKSTVHVIGDFNNWQIDSNYLLSKDTPNNRFWIELTGLTAQTNHMYQYVVDGDITIADPYSTTVLNGNDQWINTTTYPDLPLYPTGSTTHAVTLLRTGDTPYSWQNTSFQSPEKTDLVIYELLIRDFDALHSFDAVKARLDYLQTLGINAIEFMPVNEFDGNESWGYNPSFHMALDKYYGSATAFKQLIDECHTRGIAVIIDVVYNHASGQNPYYRMWNTDNGGYGGQASNDSPFFNPTATHAYSVFNDLNHSKQATQDYVKRTTQYWIDEYKIDGFRWDLTKGFTQNCTSSDEGCTGAYQSDRVAVLKEYADYQWEVNSDFYVIFEHLGGNTEETEWVNYRLGEGKGILMWGNHNGNYSEATMGFHNSGKSDFSWISYKNRGWTVPANVSYMESHDEERLMYKNLSFGNSSGGYDVTTLATALDRIELAGAFYFTVPGPKMVWQFGELGYDISINQDGRVSNKPILWNYFTEPNRKDVYDSWAFLIGLKKKYDIFRTNNFVLDVANVNGLKSIHLTNDAVNPAIKHITVIGNFGVVAQNINPQFQQTGTWYDLLNNNTSISVTNTTATISLQPGEFKIYGSSQTTLSLDDSDLTSALFTIYPNPIENSFQIKSEITCVTVFDITGRKVIEFKGNFDSNHRFSTATFKTGIYILKVTGEKGTTIQKILKK